MTAMNLSLPEELKVFVGEQARSGGFASVSDYVRELIRRERDRQALRSLLLAGAASPLSAVTADSTYFDGLRKRAREWNDASEKSRRLSLASGASKRAARGSPKRALRLLDKLDRAG